MVTFRFFGGGELTLLNETLAKIAPRFERREVLMLESKHFFNHTIQ